MTRPVQLRLKLHDELVVDNFAGGGGASLAIEQALGRPVDIAINHDREALAMHSVNHPHTIHLCEDVFAVDPRKVTMGKKVAVAWFSPDCKHFSKAKGGKPLSKRIRGLAWVAIRYAATVRPRIIFLENVEEFCTWGPLLPDGKPCPIQKGRTFKKWKRSLEDLGYAVDWRLLQACDFGAPTTRTRLFLVARCDGEPITWPEPTHGDPKSEAVRSGHLEPWRTAAECIEWSTPCHSIFMSPEEAKVLRIKRPLAEATMRRISRGVQRYVIDTAEPFIVTCNHGGVGFRGQGLREPMKTITAARDAHGLVSAFLAKNYGGNYTGPGLSLAEPAAAITTKDHHSLIAANMVRHFGKSVGSHPTEPAGTITAGGGGKTGLVTSHLLKLRGTCRDGQRTDAPAPTITGGGTHIGEVRAFLCKYYGEGGQHQDCRGPLHTIPTKARFGLVTVAGEEYVISDIGMRMLEPRELYRAQGFPDAYIINPVVNGKPLSKSAQVRMVGNSVSPQPAIALIRANVGQMAEAVAA